MEQWKIKKLIQNLESARGNGTSMISLILPPKDEISRINKKLTEELGTASNIKSRVTRLSVLGALTSLQQKLKLYNKVPENGLVLYCGTVLTSEGKEKKVSIGMEPFKPINTSLYMCDNRFHVEALKELLESDDKFGFIIMDGNGSLYGVVAGNTRTILHKFSVDLPKKHGRGGQSALRFARLRLEKRHNYLRKAAETATQMFIANDRPTVTGIILAGSAEFKTKLATSDMFDPRLAAILIATVDISYGGENGFNQAIELAAESLSNVKFVREKKLLSKYFNEISKDTGKYCFGIKDTMAALDMGALQEMIVWENLPHNRYELRDPSTSEMKIEIFDERQETDTKNFKTPDGLDYEVVDKMALLEWLANNFKNFGATMNFVTNKSQEGSQFVRGFGGIGGLLHYKLDFVAMEVNEDEDTFDDDGFI